jgi:hypothetical protein
VAKLIVVNKFGQQLEDHRVATTLIDWMQHNVPNYKDMCVPPYSATLNGVPWPYVKHDQLLDNDDIIFITIEPRDPATIYAVIAVVLAGYSYYVSSSLPQGYQDSTESGTSIYSPNAKFNSVKLNGVIREVAGNVPIYPDLICPVRRVYENHEEFLYLNLSVGVGYFDITESNLYIADTPSANYSGDIITQISAPGADVSTHDAYENWYQSKEVSDLDLIQAGTIDEGEWTITTTSSTVTTKLNGIITTFPANFNAKMIIRYFDNTSINLGGGGLRSYRVTAISGASNETATLVPADNIADYPPIDLAILTDVLVEIIIFANVENWEGPFVLVPEGEVTNTIEYDVNFQNGLVRLSDGVEFLQSVQIDVHWREVGTTVWNLLPSPNNISTFTEKTLDERGYTGRLNIDLCRPEIRFRRVTLDSKDTNIIDKVKIKRVRSRITAPISYDNVTTIQLKLRGSNALAQTAENKINMRGAQRKLPTLANLQAYVESGDPLVYSATSSIMRFVAWQMVQANDENNLDWDAFNTLETLLTSRSDELNADFSDETTLWEALKIMLSPGYCEPTIKEGLLTPVRSAASTDYNFLYTPDLMLGNGVERSDTHYNASESKGVMVEYIDAVSGDNKTVQCFLPGDTEAKAKRIQATGITSRTMAWRYGMRTRRREAFKPATISFSTELDALNSDYGNADGLVSPLNANQSFFVVDHSRVNIEGTLTDTIILDYAPNLTGGIYYAVFRKPTGHFSGLYQVIAGNLANQIYPVGPALLDFTPVYDDSMEPTICCIGLASELIERIWIRSIDPAGTDTVKVTAEEYIAEIFADDDNSPS